MSTFNQANSKFGLYTCQQKAHFFAKVFEKVGTSIDIKNGEELNYTVEKLTEHFTRFSTTGLLYSLTGTDVYACVNGVVYDDYTSDSYANTIGIEGDYNGTTYYFFYAHLSESSVLELNNEVNKIHRKENQP
jgi:molybdopterin converting factor small subunit